MSILCVLSHKNHNIANTDVIASKRCRRNFTSLALAPALCTYTAARSSQRLFPSKNSTEWNWFRWAAERCACSLSLSPAPPMDRRRAALSPARTRTLSLLLSLQHMRSLPPRFRCFRFSFDAVPVCSLRDRFRTAKRWIFERRTHSHANIHSLTPSGRGRETCRVSEWDGRQAQKISGQKCSVKHEAEAADDDDDDGDDDGDEAEPALDASGSLALDRSMSGRCCCRRESVFALPALSGSNPELLPFHWPQMIGKSARGLNWMAQLVRRSPRPLNSLRIRKTSRHSGPRSKNVRAISLRSGRTANTSA